MSIVAIPHLELEKVSYLPHPVSYLTHPGKLLTPSGKLLTPIR
jgi:hypothetical protein